MTSDGVSLTPGDLLKIERRHVVDGVVKLTRATGRFAGVQIVGTAEHLVLRDERTRSVRMFPLSSISEITLVAPVARTAQATHAAAHPPAAPAWDPGVA